MDGDKAEEVNEPLSNTVARHIPVRVHDYVIPERREVFRGHSDTTEFIARRLPRRPLECLNEVREVSVERLGMIIRNESDALPPPLARRRDCSALHSGNNWEAGPDFSMTVE